jgi:hypothetical protein
MSWRDIKDAPRDELVMLSIDGRPAVATWSEQAYWTGETADENVPHPGWVLLDVDDDGQITIFDRVKPDDPQPTGWRPLPAPEESAAEVAAVNERLHRAEAAEAKAKQTLAAKREEYQALQVELERATAEEARTEAEQEQRRLQDEAEASAAEEQRRRDEAAREQQRQAIARAIAGGAK